MPLYEYECERCRRRFEVLRRMGEDASDLTCPECGCGDVRREFSTFSGSASFGCGPSGGFT